MAVMPACKAVGAGWEQRQQPGQVEGAMQAQQPKQGLGWQDLQQPEQ